MKQWMKKSLAACLALVMCLTLAACGGKEGETPAEESVNVRVAALKGPTAMGMVKLMSDYAPVEEALEDKENVVTAGGGNTYEFTLAASADEVSPKLMQGELDIACVPANLASVLYNRTDGGIVTLAVNTLGVLYIVENGNSVQSMADLAGRTIVASGKGSTPEYALRYLLTENGIDPDTGVTIDWKSEHSECVASLASGAATIAMLPQPFVTVAQTQLPDLRVALDLTEEWDALDNGSALLTGVVVALIFTGILYLARRLMSIAEYVDGVWEGFSTMVSVLALLVIAFMFKSACESLGMDQFIIEKVAPLMGGQLLPFVIFLVATVMTFALANAWGVSAIMVPLVVPLVQAMDANMAVAIAAIFSGSVFGTQLCFYSDNSILIGQATNILPLDHVRTQMPFALCAGVLAAAAYLIYGFAFL